ncbi:MAG: hypothetical protein ACPGXL_04025 [Chitinophagales bacterium]
MELLFRICLGIASIINLLPALLVFLPNRIASSYGIDVPNANYELLLRHRAVLFGIVGGLMLYAAISQKYYDLAVVVGLVSMVSFVILVPLVSGDINAALKKVMYVDLVGIAILVVGFVLFKLQ